MFYILDKSMQEFQCQLFSMEIHQSFTYSPIGNYLKLRQTRAHFNTFLC
jgi:hypothetical protein